MNGEAQRAGIREVMLARRGIAYVDSIGLPLADAQLRAVELELAEIGYVLSSKLKARLARSSLDELVGFRAWALRVLLAQLGGDQKHKPLFRQFPKGVPTDTLELWWTKVLVHFLQSDEQPCLFCRRVGTTHVLNPCEHVVCNHCFDGSNYSACPVCEHHVDQTSPFFQSPPERAPNVERVIFKLIDLGENLNDEARALFVNLCERKQALAPADRDALTTIVRECGTAVFAWLPQTIPVRENVATIFGTLCRQFDPGEVLTHARSFMTTPTDVLRFIAVLSGKDGSLLRETIFKSFEKVEGPSRFWGRIADFIGAPHPAPPLRNVQVPIQVNRFKVAKLSRPLRRALLAMLEGMRADSLVEDMLRHQSYWVWVGQFLHPHEYALRFPKVTRAFQIVREKDPRGTPAPHFETWYSKVEKAAIAKDSDAMLAVLLERPGEFARRFDFLLRTATDDAARMRVVAALEANMSAFATPVLLTLKAHLPARVGKAAVRVYWPKGRVARGVSSKDERDVLPRDSIDRALRFIDAELLARFAKKPPFSECLIDEGLRTIVVPFNERTASRSAVSLPRGSRIPVAAGKFLRLFLHWCQPAKGGEESDLDLSVGFYDDNWRHIGVCSYYQLESKSAAGQLLARSAGDLRDAPWPDGASEFVDLHAEAALAAGVRYAVMVVNNYAGMAFSQLERAFAGIMLRDDMSGEHFDPRTVELKFALDGENGVFLPIVLDLRSGVLHWLDVHSRGGLAFNNVSSSNSAITKICPEQMSYFESGVRASMFDLGLLHAAARCQRVLIRGSVGGAATEFVRERDEGVVAFYTRLVAGQSKVSRTLHPRVDGPPMLALLFRGDLELPAGSPVYALFRESVTPTIVASDLLS
jgi:hypothetical protein